MKTLYLLLGFCVIGSLECTDKPTSSRQLQSTIVSGATLGLCYCMFVLSSRNHIKSFKSVSYPLGKWGFLKSQMGKRK